MTDPLGQDNLREHLTAFADGELDATQILAVLEYIKAEPEAINLLREQQKLRVAAMRAVRQSAPSVPAALRERIAKLAATPTIETQPTSPPHRRETSHRRLFPLAVAAVLCLAVGMGVSYVALRPGGKSSENVASVPPRNYNVAPSTVAAIKSVHVNCSRFAARLHDADIPKELGEFATALGNDFSQGAPDLSDMGYELIGAGPCRKPLENTIHLLYRSTAKDLNDTLSIFVQPIEALTQLQPGKFYPVSDATSAHPMFAWRTSGAAYFLVGDEMETTERARSVLAGTDKL